MVARRRAHRRAQRPRLRGRRLHRGGARAGARPAAGNSRERRGGARSAADLVVLRRSRRRRSDWRACCSRRNMALQIGGVVLIALPHIVGAPHPQEFVSTAPGRARRPFRRDVARGDGDLLGRARLRLRRLSTSGSPAPDEGGIVLVLGGARSGKSAYAERLVAESGLAPRLHRDRRAPATPRWPSASPSIAPAAGRTGGRSRRRTGLEDALAREAGEGRAVLVDCLTLWLSNLMLAGADVEARGASALPRRRAGCRASSSSSPTRSGSGSCRTTPLGRRFRDAQGRLNQAVAAVADRVVFMAAGLPLLLKGSP